VNLSTHVWEATGLAVAASSPRYAATACAAEAVSPPADEMGGSIFEYDRPLSLFGQFGNEHVTKVWRYLDATLETVLHR
jgi:hypothetical protein